MGETAGEGFGLGGIITLNELKEIGCRVCRGFTWLRVGTDGEPLQT